MHTSKWTLVSLLILALAGCSQPKPLPQAQQEADLILGGKIYASEKAGQEILVRALSEKARQGQEIKPLLEMAKASRKLPWSPNLLIFEAASQPDFVRQGLASVGPKRRRLLGLVGQASGDFQQLAQACVSKDESDFGQAYYRSFWDYTGYRLPGALRFYGSAYYNRDLVTEDYFGKVAPSLADLFDGQMLAHGFLRMRPFGTRAQSPAQTRALAFLQTSSPRAAALLYLGWPKLHSERDGIEWSSSILERGLAELEKDYPQSLWLHTRRLELKNDPQWRRDLGHRWERTPGQEVPPAGVEWSRLPACQVGSEKTLLDFAPQEGPHLTIQVRDLVLRHQFETLHALLARLAETSDPRLELAYWGTVGQAQLASALTQWQSSSPKSVAVIGLRAWHELNSGPGGGWKSIAAGKAESFPDNLGEDPLSLAITAALRTSRGQTSAQLETLVVNSLRRNYLQDQVLEAIADTAPDLKSARDYQAWCDRLRQQLGHDRAYHRAMTRALLRKSVQPEQLDWARFAASLDGLKPDLHFTPSWAIQEIHLLCRLNRQREAHLLVGICNSSALLAPTIHPRLHQRVLQWAQLKGPWPLGPQQLRTGRCFWSMRAVRTPEEAAMRTSEREYGRDCVALEGHEIGFELSLARPVESEQKWVVKVEHPPFPWPEGRGYSVERRPMLVTPDDGSKLEVSYVIAESDRPGTYFLSLEEAETGKVLASQSFNVQP